jgi:VIT1/CCC1 family predicted Fe2+/Mn2+ transporter
MRIVIVGKKNGVRKIQWLNFFLLTFVLGIIGGLVGGGIYYLLCRRWSHTAVISAAAIIAGTMFLGLIKSLSTPIDKLRELT